MPLLPRVEGIDRDTPIVRAPPNWRLECRRRRGEISPDYDSARVRQDDCDITLIRRCLTDDLTGSGSNGDRRIMRDLYVDGNRKAGIGIAQELRLPLVCRSDTKTPCLMRFNTPMDDLSRIPEREPVSTRVRADGQRNKPRVCATPIVLGIEQPSVEHTVEPLPARSEFDGCLGHVVQIAGCRERAERRWLSTAGGRLLWASRGGGSGCSGCGRGTMTGRRRGLRRRGYRRGRIRGLGRGCCRARRGRGAPLGGKTTANQRDADSE